MADKSLRDRVAEKLPEFSAIYKSYRDAYESSSKHSDAWQHAFSAPFESSIKRYLVQHPAEADDFRPSPAQTAVTATIHELELQDLRLRPITYRDSRITAALEFGLLTVDDLAPLYELPEKEQRSLGMGPITRGTADRDDPFFWRALLEILCRAYLAREGRPPWTLLQKIDLAFDLDEIRQQLEGKWSQTAALKLLREKEPYRSKYRNPKADRKDRQGIGLSRVKEVCAWMNPMDETALDQLREKFGAAFFEVADRRVAKLLRPTTDLRTIKATLEEAGRLGEAIAGAGRSR